MYKNDKGARSFGKNGAFVAEMRNLVEQWLKLVHVNRSSPLSNHSLEVAVVFDRFFDLLVQTSLISDLSQLLVH